MIIDLWSAEFLWLFKIGEVMKVLKNTLEARLTCFDFANKWIYFDSTKIWTIIGADDRIILNEFFEISLLNQGNGCYEKMCTFL